MNKKQVVICVALAGVALALGYLLLLGSRPKILPVYQTWQENNRAGELQILDYLHGRGTAHLDTAREYLTTAETEIGQEYGFFQPNPWIPYIDYLQDRGGKDNLITRRYPDIKVIEACLEDPNLVHDGAFSRIAPDRFKNDRIERVCETIGIKPGTTGAEIGFGKGYYLPYFSSRVGPSGTVYGVEVDSGLINYMKDRLEYGGIKNVKLFETPFESIRKDLKTGAEIPTDSLGWVFMFDVYHCMTKVLDTERDPNNFNLTIRPWLESIYTAMKPGGRIAIVDLVRTNPEHSAEVNPETVVKHLLAVGFKHIGTFRLLDAGKDDDAYFFYAVFVKPCGLKKIINLWESPRGTPSH